MRPLGKTYLIKCKNQDQIEKNGSIFIVNDINIINDVYWKGEIFDYGIGFSDDEIKDLLPKGTNIVMSYGKNNSDKGGTKLVIGKTVFYIRSIDEIIGEYVDE